MMSGRSCLDCHCRASSAAFSSCSSWLGSEADDADTVAGEVEDDGEVEEAEGAFDLSGATEGWEPRSKDGVTLRSLTSMSLAVRK